jgi:hypothetical protein
MTTIDAVLSHGVLIALSAGARFWIAMTDNTVNPLLFAP